MKDGKALWSCLGLKALIRTMTKTKQIFSMHFLFLLLVFTTDVCQIFKKIVFKDLKRNLNPINISLPMYCGIQKQSNDN